MENALGETSRTQHVRESGTTQPWKLDQLEKRFDELTQQMADPAIISDADQYRKVAKAARAECM